MFLSTQNVTDPTVETDPTSPLVIVVVLESVEPYFF